MAQGKRAITCFVEDNEHLIQQTLALRRSWLHVGAADTDLVVFAPPHVLARLPEDIVKLPQRPVADDPEWGGYRYANGIAYLNSPEAWRLDEYTQILHTDVDTFIAPGWHNFRPDGFNCGTGGYNNTPQVRENLAAVAEAFGLTHRGFANAGATWYGPPALLRSVAALAEMLTRNILLNYFRKREFTWPGWYWGVSSMYGAELAINHLVANPQRSDRLDAYSTSTAKPVAECVHIHCWHTEEDFSKHRFMAGGYRDTDPATLNLDIVPQYALAMSLASLHDLAVPGAPTPSSDVASPVPAAAATATSVEATRVDVDEAVRRLLQVRLGERPVSEAAGLLALPPSDLARAADYHGIASFIAPVVEDAASPGSPLGRVWTAVQSRNVHAARARQACLDRLLDAFEAGGIVVVVLKGGALAHLIYETPDLRQMVDIDLLVRRGDLRRAAAIAEAQGFAFAAEHPSRFAGRTHHLPGATRKEAGFEILLELHDDALAPDASGSITLDNLTTPPRPFQREGGKATLALGHADMLRHLTQHAFEPSSRVRLKHLLDLWLYTRKFAAELPSAALPAKAVVAIEMAELVLRSGSATDVSPQMRASIGKVMTPLSIAASMGRKAQLAALFDPPEWWLRGYYGIPLGASPAFHRAVIHPLTVTRWLARRGIAGLGLSSPNHLPKEN